MSILSLDVSNNRRVTCTYEAQSDYSVDCIYLRVEEHHSHDLIGPRCPHSQLPPGALVGLRTIDIIWTRSVQGYVLHI